jgi:hypothetical protein
MRLLSLAVAVALAGLLPGAMPQAQQPAERTMALVFTTGPGWDASKPPNAQAHFGSHSANLRRLKEAGVIVAGGRFGPYGLILVRAPTADSARAMLVPDSSLVVGTFKVDVSPWATIYEGTITR